MLSQIKVFWIICYILVILMTPAHSIKSKVIQLRQRDSTDILEESPQVDALLDQLESCDDYREYALKILSKDVVKYFERGALSQNTLHENIAAFKRYRFRPRMLRDVSERVMSTVLLGTKVNFPIGIAPTASQKLASRYGEISTAQAACDLGTVMILSSYSTTSLEKIAKTAPECDKWHQLYIFKNKSVTIDIIQRVERSGYKALVVTVDSPYHGRDLEHHFAILPPGYKWETMHKYYYPGMEFPQKISRSDPSLTWEDIKILKSITKLPIVLKGILTGEDAKIAASIGVDAVYVSNHGGRQLDNVPATIEVLPEVVRAVRDYGIDVYMDSGIRNGSDVLVALALGAKAVFIGRPNIYGLAVGGTKGSKSLLRRLKDELEMAMGLAGIKSLLDIPKGVVVREKYYDQIAPPYGSGLML